MGPFKTILEALSHGFDPIWYAEKYTLNGSPACRGCKIKIKNMSLIIRCDLTTAFKYRSEMKPGKAKLKQDKQFKIRAENFYFHNEKVCMESHIKKIFKRKISLFTTKIYVLDLSFKVVYCYVTKCQHAK